MGGGGATVPNVQVLDVTFPQPHLLLPVRQEAGDPLTAHIFKLALSKNDS